MKNVKKVLALVLAVTMMFGVVSVCASAIDTTTASYKFTFKDADGNVIDSAKAGDKVNVFVGIKTDGYSPIFEFIAFYDYVALTQVSATSAANLSATSSRVLHGRFANKDALEDVSQELLDREANYAATGEILDWGAAGFTVTLHKANMYPSSWGDTEKAQYKAIKFAYKTKVDVSVMTVNTNNEFVDVLNFSFTANKDTALDKNIFFLSPDATKSYISIYPEDECISSGQSLSSVKVTGDNLKVEYSTTGGSSEAKPVVSNLETQVRWQDKNVGLLDIGFCGSVSGLTPELDTDGVTVKNVTRIGFKFSRTDATLTNDVTTVDAYTLYDFTAETAGTYKFRAVVTGDTLSYDRTDALYACAFIQIGSEEILATNAKIDTTINAEYLDAVNNHNMPAFGA